MVSLEFDRFGVPVLTGGKIDTLAVSFVAKYRPASLGEPTATPIVEIVERVKEHHGFSVSYAAELGETDDGQTIMGITRQQPLSIYINALLQNDTRFRFVLGHELGHIILHRGVDLKRAGYSDVQLDDVEHDLVSGHKKLKLPRDFIEWQANRFASAILMPALTFEHALVNAQRERGITRNRGVIYVDASWYSRNEYSGIRRELALIFNVTELNVECRLKDLKLLQDHRGSPMVHISQVNPFD